MLTNVKIQNATIKNVQKWTEHISAGKAENVDMGHGVFSIHTHISIYEKYVKDTQRF